MVAFRKAMAGTTVTRLWDNSGDAVAYMRGDKGWVMLNAGATNVTATIATGLPAGTYCDVLTGGKIAAACAGRSVVIAADGTTTITLGAQSALAIHTGHKL